MADDLEKHFCELVKPLFSNHAGIHTFRDSDDICLLIDWKLKNDSERLNKRSKKIRIRIADVAIDDYVNREKKHREGADERLKAFVDAQLQTFNPDHNVPALVPVPVVEWTITTQLLNA